NISAASRVCSSATSISTSDGKSTDASCSETTSVSTGIAASENSCIPWSNLVSAQGIAAITIETVSLAPEAAPVGLRVHDLGDFREAAEEIGYLAREVDQEIPALAYRPGSISDLDRL